MDINSTSKFDNLFDNLLNSNEVQVCSSNPEKVTILSAFFWRRETDFMVETYCRYFPKLISHMS